MNYKKMALVLFLVPMISCASNVQDSIKQLEQERESLQTEIAQLDKYINEQAELLDIYKRVAKECWDTGEVFFLNKEYENRFNAFINELQIESQKGGDIFAILEQNKLVNKSFPATDLIFSRVVNQHRHLADKCTYCRKLIKDILTIKKQLKDLYEQI